MLKLETNELILLRLNRLYFFKCAVAKKKKRKRMIRQMLNWNTDVALATNEQGFMPVAEIELRHFKIYTNVERRTKS